MGTAVGKAKVRRCLGLLLTALAVGVPCASAALTSVGGIDVQALADSLQSNPVAVRGSPDPTLSAAAIKSLSARIAARDRGRIRIAVVSPVSVQATGDLAQALSDAINADGVVIVVAGSNYHVTTTWGTGDAARALLSDAVVGPHISLAVQMRRAIDSFARADAAAGHPGSNSSESGQPQSRSNGGGSSGSGGGGLVSGLIGLGVVLVTAALIGGKRIRRTLRSSHRRKEESADAQAQARADLITLGEDIEALDIDSSMPNASAQGKDEYGKAIECYQDADHRLHSADDSYQFERAVDALRRGHAHVQSAGALFNPSADHPTAPTTSDGPSGSDAAAVRGPIAARAPEGIASIVAAWASSALAGASAPQSRDVVDELAKLAALHSRGALTDAEFAEQKAKLLAQD